MSEPWLRQNNWSEELHFNSTMGTNIAGNAGATSALLATALNHAHGDGHDGLNGSSAGTLFPQFSFNSAAVFPRGVAGLYNAEHRLGYPALETSLPHMLDQYAAIYNKNGRIGIYTREVRHRVLSTPRRRYCVWRLTGG
jgi:hypothetical protein